MHVFHYFFDWYQGQIWPNLLASAITTLFVGVWGFRKLFKLHHEHTQQVHNHISQEFANLTDKSKE